MKKLTLTQWSSISFAIAAIAICGLAWYGHNSISALSENIDSLSSRIVSLEGNLSSTTLALQGTIATTQSALANRIDEQKKSVGSISEQLGTYQQQVGDINGKVTTLTKLSKIDPQLLLKYSKVFFLNENYVPARLTEIPNAYKYTDSKLLTFHTDALPYLQKMIDAAGKDGVKIYVQSAYRSFPEQRALKGAYAVTYGAGTANSFSAEQGYSEHQLGTAVDMTTTGINGGLDGFDRTLAYKWMLSNAHNFGFVISYPKDNAYYVFEPWHWRFVGVRLATYLHEQNQNFYDLDQRKIDEYLISIF